MHSVKVDTCSSQNQSSTFITSMKEEVLLESMCVQSTSLVVHTITMFGDTRRQGKASGVGDSKVFFWRLIGVPGYIRPRPGSSNKMTWKNSSKPTRNQNFARIISVSCGLNWKKSSSTKLMNLVDFVNLFTVKIQLAQHTDLHIFSNAQHLD